MNIQHNISLKPYNTLRVEATTDYFVEISHLNELQELINSSFYKNHHHIIIGGGSNILFINDFSGLVIKNNIKGKKIYKENNNHIWLQIGAGEAWHDIVMYCISKGYGGIENLSLIPGLVGAAPMQNIGAYGVEIVQVFDHLHATSLNTGKERIFENKDCKFGYRESIFKNRLKNQYIITSVTLKLTKTDHNINTDYGAIQDTLSKMEVANPTITDVSKAVISIRHSKLPDPKKIGNAGSFFKNPVIDKVVYDKLKIKYPAIPGYTLIDRQVKVPAGWLIEQCGWKGKTIGNIGIHSKQALVIVNYNNAKGQEIKILSQKIQNSVLDKFGIEINPEVNFV